jgi:outer membrane receptor protein involved in Fe transport
LNKRSYGYTGAYVNGLDIPGWYNVQNTTSAAVSEQSVEHRRLIGLFAQAELGYKGLLFLNLSARNDWSSTLPKDRNSFFYGGVNASLLLTELLPSLKEHSVDFLKVRAAVGQTGNDAGVYRTSTWFNPLTSSTFYYTRLPIGGVSGLSENNRLPSQILKPEMTTEYELGISSNFVNNRVSIDVAYYNKQTKDQIISATLAPETSYTSETRNVGHLENKGIEALLSVIPIRTRDWEWEISGTFTKNKSKVIELWDDLDSYTYTSWRGIEYVLAKGEPIGTFRIPSLERVKDEKSPYYGYVVINSNGFPTASTTEKEIIGASQPDFMVGFNTSLKYKDFRLTVTGDWRKGGYMVSNTSYITHFNGNSTQTVYNERNSFIYPHSAKLVNGEYVENNIMVRADQMSYALGNYSYNSELRKNFILPKDFFKVREITLSYNVPKRVLTNTPLSRVTVSVIGRNLFLFTPKKNNYVDPESTNLGNDLTSEFGETTSVASTRNFGGAIKIEF